LELLGENLDCGFFLKKGFCQGSVREPGNFNFHPLPAGRHWHHIPVGWSAFDSTIYSYYLIMQLVHLYSYLKSQQQQALRISAAPQFFVFFCNICS